MAHSPKFAYPDIDQDMNAAPFELCNEVAVVLRNKLHEL